MNLSGSTESLSASNPADLTRAATLIKAGQLVAFPTETVYGLGANALSATAVARVFEAKGRPADNPLIVHVLDFQAACELWSASDEQLSQARRLAERFWPGPLSLVLPATTALPAAVTAGLGSVAVRAPANLAARQLLESSGCPLAAPSANASGRPSPTRADHVLATLDGRIAAVLDAGPTTLGIESTVVDLSGSRPQLLRPGSISEQQLRQVLGDTLLASTSEGLQANSEKNERMAASPGMRHRHYQPSGVRLKLMGRDELVAALKLTAGKDKSRAGLAKEGLAKEGLQKEGLPKEGLKKGVAVLCRQSTGAAIASSVKAAPVEVLTLPDDAGGYAAMLYQTLYRTENMSIEQLWIERPPDNDEWRAVNDRLRRAAAG